MSELSLSFLAIFVDLFFTMVPARPLLDFLAGDTSVERGFTFSIRRLLCLPLPPSGVFAAELLNPGV